MAKEEQPKKLITIGRVILAIISIIGVSGVIAIIEHQQQEKINKLEIQLKEDEIERKRLEDKRQRELDELDKKQKEDAIAEQEYQERLTLYNEKLKEWNDFSPKSLRGSREKTLRPFDRFDLETGLSDSAPASNEHWDLIWGCPPHQYESLRALNNASWYEYGHSEFEEISYRDIRDANYRATTHPKTGYKDLFYAHMSNVPTDGYVYFVKTSDNNVAKLQIIDYTLYDNNPMVCRDINIRYEVFPIEKDPTKPDPPSR